MSDNLNELGTLVPKQLVENLLVENARLKAEVERLDNLVRYWSEKYQEENARFLRACERIKAKEGKQP